MHDATERPLRVLHLDDGALWRGGQHQVWLLMNQLFRHGVEQLLMTREGSPLAVRAREANFEVEAVHARGELDWPGMRRMARRAEAFSPDIIHAHTGHAHTVGLGLHRALGRRPRLLISRRVDFPVARGFFSRRKYLARDLHYIAISNGVRGVLLKGGVPAERISVVNSGVPPIAADACVPREQVRRDLGIGPDEFAIVNVGALTDHKDHRTLIEALPAVLAERPEARLHILGDGELREDLERRIAMLRLGGRVVLHGYIDDARLKLSGFDLFALSSHLEGLGTAVLDAMRAGLPVVATRTGGVPEVVLDGQTGRLVPPRDPAALAGAILAALAEPDRTLQMIEAAGKHVEAHFSDRSMAEGTLAVYRMLLR